MADAPKDPKDGPRRFDPRPRAEKSSEERLSYEAGMTENQASLLLDLCEEADETFDPDLTRAEASEMITRLQVETGRKKSVSTSIDKSGG